MAKRKFMKRKINFRRKNKKFKHIASYFGQKPSKRDLEVDLGIYCATDNGLTTGHFTFPGGTHAVPVLNMDVLSFIYTSGNNLYSHEADALINVFRIMTIEGVTLIWIPTRNMNSTPVITDSSDFRIGVDNTYSGDVSTLAPSYYEGDNQLNCAMLYKSAKRFDFGKRPIFTHNGDLPINSWFACRLLASNVGLVLTLGYKYNCTVPLGSGTMLHSLGNIRIIYHCKYAKPVSVSPP